MRKLFPIVVIGLLFSFSLFAATAADHAAAANQAFDRGEYQKAVDLFAKAIALDAKNAEYHYMQGAAYGELAQRAGILKQAALAKKTKAAFEKAVEVDPNFVEARFGLISYYLIAPGFMGGGVDKAEAQAAEIMKRDRLDGHRAWGRIHANQKKMDLARKEYVDAVREQPRNARAHYFLGNFYLREKNWTAALHEYDMAIELDPSFMSTYYFVGELAGRSESNYARGEESMRKYLAHKPSRTEPRHAGAWYWLGVIQEKQGRKADAKTSFTNALKLSPADDDIQAALKRVK